MKCIAIIAFVSLSFMNCNNTTNTTRTRIIKSRTDSVSQKENNVKAMLDIIKKDYPDGKSSIMDSTKKVFEKRIKELDSLKNVN